MDKDNKVRYIGTKQAREFKDIEPAFDAWLEAGQNLRRVQFALLMTGLVSLLTLVLYFTLVIPASVFKLIAP